MAKIYLDNDLINNNYTYYLSNNTIVIRTNENCYNNYNTQYCDCIDVFPELDYARTNRYSCSSSYSHTISPSSFSNDWVYKINIGDSFIIFMILLITIIYVPIKVFSRLFGRWLKW